MKYEHEIFMKQQLLNFLKDWLHSAENPDDLKIPKRDLMNVGLCIGFDWYLDRNIGDFYRNNIDISGHEFLERYYFNGVTVPFHGYSSDAYYETMHKNKQRLKWVKKTIENLSEELK